MLKRNEFLMSRPSYLSLLERNETSERDNACADGGAVSGMVTVTACADDRQSNP